MITATALYRIADADLPNVEYVMIGYIRTITSILHAKLKSGVKAMNMHAYL